MKTRRTRVKTPGTIDLRALVQAKYPLLPDNQRKVADFLVQRAADIPFLSVVEIERLSGTSKATVVRLAQSLGFSGFLELRARLLEGIQTQIQKADQFSLLSTTERKGTLSSVAHQDVKNINQTINQLDRDAFMGVAGMIVKASHVYTVGLGSPR